MRDRRVGVMSTGPAAVHQALLFRQLTGHVTVLEHTGPPLTAEQRAQLDAVGIAVVQGEVVAVESAGDHVTGVRLADGTVIALDAVVVAPICYARADLLAPLGLHPAEFRAGDASWAPICLISPVARRPLRVSTSRATSPTFRNRSSARPPPGLPPPRRPTESHGNRTARLVRLTAHSGRAQRHGRLLCGENYDNTSGSSRSVCR